MPLIELIETNLEKKNHTPIWRFPEEKNEFPISELYDRAIEYAHTFTALGVEAGDTVGFMLNNCSDFVPFLIGLWKINAMAVPLRPHAGSDFDIHAYLNRIEKSCQFKLIIFNDDANEDLINSWTGLSGRQGYRRSEFIGIHPVTIKTDFPSILPSDIAVIQYSSGSTGDPKGVIVTHEMVMNQVRQIDFERRVAGQDKEIESTGSWLPFNHDMGLFIGILHPLFAWSNNILASPRYYMYKPKRWFELQSQYQVEWNFTTNMAMANSLRSLAQLAPGAIDLSLFYLYLSAEKVSPTILRKCYEVLKEFNMPEDHFKVGYGMAENTLGAASTKQGKINTVHVCIDENSNTVQKTDGHDNNAVEVVSIGSPHINTTMTVRDEAGNILPEMTLGEICIQGHCVFPGYHRDEEVSKKALVEGMFKTRDLGFYCNGDLYFYSRKDAMLVVGGRNIAPEDIEDCAEGMEGFSVGGTALIEVEQKSVGTNKLVLLVEMEDKRHRLDLTSERHRIQSEIYQKKGILISTIVFCGKNTIVKTTSGKKRRKAIKETFEKEQKALCGNDSL